MDFIFENMITIGIALIVVLVSVVFFIMMKQGKSHSTEEDGEQPSVFSQSNTDANYTLKITAFGVMEGSFYYYFNSEHTIRVEQ